MLSAFGDVESEKLWGLRRAYSASLKATGLTKLNEDIVVPRGRLQELFRLAAGLQKRHGIQVACFGHAGDGNIHPLVLYDESAPGEVERVLAAGDEILRACLDLGGSITGEHGIGIEKLGLMQEAFTAPTLAAMADVRAAFDPRSLCNPGKVLPSSRTCVEVTRPRPRGGG